MINEMEVDGFEFNLSTQGPFIECDSDADRLVTEINKMAQLPEKVMVKVWDTYKQEYMGNITMYKDIAIELGIPNARKGGTLKYWTDPFGYSSLTSMVRRYTRIYELGMNANVTKEEIKI